MVQVKKSLAKAVAWIRRHPLASSVLAVLGLYLATRLLCIGRLPIFFDEAVLIRWSQVAMRRGSYLVSMTDGRPPLHIWIMIPFLKMISDPLLAGRLASAACGILSATLMVAIGDAIGDWKLGAAAGVLYVVCPFTLWYDRVAIAEGPLLTVFLTAVYLALKCARSLRSGWVPGIGAAVSAGLLIKPTSQLLFLILPFAYLARRKEDPERKHALLRWMLMVAAALAIGYAIFSLLRFSEWYPHIATRTALTTKGLGEVLSNPFDILWTNVREMAKTIVVFFTPALFAVSLGGLVWGAYKRWRPAFFLIEWFAVVFLVEALISRHWMFETVLPRFVLSVVPPLLLGAAYLSVEVLEGLGRLNWSGGIRRSAAAGLLVLVLAFPVVTDVLVIVKPEAAVLPQWVRFQYITDWPSGWGIAESVRFLAGRSESEPVTVGSNFKGPVAGLPTNALELYLADDPDVELVPFSFGAEVFPERLREAAAVRPTYCVVNMFSGSYGVPEDWPLELIRRFPKDGNDSMSMLLYRVVP